MRHKALKLTGWFLCGLVFAGVVAMVIIALITGKAFVGVNYYGLPIGTYCAAAVLTVTLICSVILGIKQLRLVATAPREPKPK